MEQINNKGVNLREKLDYIFMEDTGTTEYFVEYMGEIQRQVLGSKYDLVVCVEETGGVVFRSFLIGWKNIKTPIISTKTFCNYFGTPDLNGNLIKYMKDKCKKDLKNFKVLVFGDVLNRGGNTYDCFMLLKKHGINAENITYASPTINERVLADFGNHKFIVKEEIGSYFLCKRANEEKLATLFLPKIEYYLERYSLGFVNDEEIISRAYQFNQYAHIIGMPYTAYCAYVTTNNNEIIAKIKGKILDNAENNFLEELGYEKSYVRKLNSRVCNTVGVSAYIIILDFDILTGNYAGIRVFENPETGFMTFFPFISQSLMERADLREEYGKYGDFFADINDENPFWEEQFCFINSDKNSENEDKYFRLKCFVETAAGCLINVKTGLLLWDFFVKLQVGENSGNNGVFDNLAKCISRQFFQFDYVENKAKIKENVRKKLKNFYEEKIIDEKLGDLVRFKNLDNIKSLEELNEIYDNNRLFWDNGDVRAYEKLDAVVTDFERGRNISDKNIPDKNYLCFCQEFGAFFNNLKIADTHKIPPFPVHKLMQIVVKNVMGFEFFTENLGNNREIFNDCIAAYITVTEDGFGGNCEEILCKNDKLYLVNCCEHGETSNQVNNLYFSDFQCISECLELTLTEMNMKNGNRETYKKSLSEQIQAEIDKFNKKFGDNKKYTRFMDDFKNFGFYVDCAFDEKNENRLDLVHFPVLGGRTFVEESEYMQKLLYGFDFVEDADIVKFLNDVIKIEGVLGW